MYSNLCRRWTLIRMLKLLLFFFCWCWIFKKWGRKHDRLRVISEANISQIITSCMLRARSPKKKNRNNNFNKNWNVCFVVVCILVYIYFVGGNRWKILCAGNSAWLIIIFLSLVYYLFCICLPSEKKKLCSSIKIAICLPNAPRSSNQINIQKHCHDISDRFDLTEIEFIGIFFLLEW